MANKLFKVLVSGMVILAFQPIVQTLVCYKCSSCHTVNDQTETVTVVDDAGYSCMKTIMLAGTIAILTSRDAILNCQSTDNIILGVGQRTTCCNTDRCNSAPSLSVPFNLLLLFTVSFVILQRLGMK